MRTVVLASTSPFRASLMRRLEIPFETFSPDVDETRLPGEDAVSLVKRLAALKASAASDRYPDALIIGSDQVAMLNDSILGKPGTHENAVRQLSAASGKNVVFQTGLCLLDAATGDKQIAAIPYEVQFRQLSNSQIEYYLQTEQPYNAAGSFKSEALGGALFSAMNGSDPSSLIGLPLISLTEMLMNAGLDVLSPQS